MAHVTWPRSAPARRQTHPATWVVTAAIIPLLCWDAWQTYKEARLKMSVEAKWSHTPRESGYVPPLKCRYPVYWRPTRKLTHGRPQDCIFPRGTHSNCSV